VQLRPIAAAGACGAAAAAPAEAREAVTPQPARFARDRSVRASTTWVVGPGDSLRRIARRTLGSEERWRELWDANRDELPDPRLLYPGQVLRVPRGAPPPPPPAAGVRPATPPDPTAVARFLAAARAFLGQPFRWGGGHVPRTLGRPGPVDGSGLVQQAARAAGASLDGTAAAQQRLGRAVPLDALHPGDLLFQGEPARHVGIYLGEGQVLHASSRAGKVVAEPLGPEPIFTGARRVF
jgi:cell wall-associated NlpC family hydrolase